jgi:uncharacterized protein
MRILRSADYRRMPWKNGGGETREIAVSPAGATLESLDWRVSLASVATDGPFSVFKDVQRTLCVIQGAGIELRVGDADPTSLHVTSEPFSFDGEASTRARLIDGPIEDLNVMTRCGRFRHTVKRCAIDGEIPLSTEASTLMIYCQRGDVTCHAGAESASLRWDDSACFDEVADIRLATSWTAEIIVVELHPVTSSR